MTRAKINNRLLGLPIYSQSIPLSDIFDILECFGYVPIMEDRTLWQGIICGENGRMQLQLAFCDADTFGYDVLTTIDNSIIITWYRMQSGNWEVMSYVV